MATKRVFNPTDSPIVIDDEGHILGGGEWADLDVADDTVSGLLDQERLLIPATAKSSKSSSAPAVDKQEE